MTNLSPETIRFRLWQFRKLYPGLTQDEAATAIGCPVKQLREETSGWKRGGKPGVNSSPRPETTACDSFIENPSYYLTRSDFRSRLSVINGSLL